MHIVVALLQHVLSTAKSKQKYYPLVVHELGTRLYTRQYLHLEALLISIKII